MTFSGALLSRGMYMGVSIDQMTNDGYFATQKDHLHLLEGVSKIFGLTPPLIVARMVLCHTENIYFI